MLRQITAVAGGEGGGELAEAAGVRDPAVGAGELVHEEQVPGVGATNSRRGEKHGGSAVRAGRLAVAQKVTVID
ncbi:hypothetical protein GCM10009534_36310 [Kribbella sandramycini]